MTACTVPGCDGDHYAKGFCRPHYARWHRTGMPTRPIDPTLPPVASTRRIPKMRTP